MKEPGFDFEEVARRCEGYSGSDLMELCKQAAYRPLRQLLRDEQGMRQLSDDLDSRTTGQVRKEKGNGSQEWGKQTAHVLLCQLACPLLQAERARDLPAVHQPAPL